MSARPPGSAPHADPAPLVARFSEPVPAWPPNLPLLVTRLSDGATALVPQPPPGPSAEVEHLLEEALALLLAVLLGRDVARLALELGLLLRPGGGGEALDDL